MDLNPLRNLPSVNDLLESPRVKRLVDTLSHNAVVNTVRKVLDEVRQEVQTSAAEGTMPSVGDLADRIARRVGETEASELRPVINATGILLPAGMAGVPLADEAIAAMAAVGRDYANVELDLASGQPSRRGDAVHRMLAELTGAERALVVNSRAAASILTLASLAGGREVIVSRGQMLEADDGYSLPNVLTASGAATREIGATNRTRLDDYAGAIGTATAALWTVQVSYYAQLGSVESVALGEVVKLGRSHRLPVVHDLCLGALVDLADVGLSGELVVGHSIRQGADVVIFSGDGLLGGPACGLIVGRRQYIDAIERHAMTPAMRVDKLTLAALAATLRLYGDPAQAWQSLPLLQLLATSEENLANRARRLAPQMAACPAVAEAEAVRDVTSLTGNSLAAQQLPTWCVALKSAATSAERLAARLRTGVPSVVGRVRDERVWLDLRSVPPRQDVQLVLAVEALEVVKEPSK
jgi:L-seryl-tRNA(Ser) seleniumtransferase